MDQPGAAAEVSRGLGVSWARWSVAVGGGGGGGDSDQMESSLGGCLGWES